METQALLALMVVEEVVKVVYIHLVTVGEEALVVTGALLVVTQMEVSMVGEQVVIRLLVAVEVVQPLGLTILVLPLVNKYQ
jgi:hypothetical protein